MNHDEEERIQHAMQKALSGITPQVDGYSRIREGLEARPHKRRVKTALALLILAATVALGALAIASSIGPLFDAGGAGGGGSRITIKGTPVPFSTRPCEEPPAATFAPGDASGSTAKTGARGCVPGREITDFNGSFGSGDTYKGIPILGSSAGGGTPPILATLSAMLFLGAIVGSISVVVYDMNRRGQPGMLYGLLVWFLFPIGIVLWLIMRREKPVLRTHPPFLGGRERVLVVAILSGLALGVVMLTLAYANYSESCLILADTTHACRIVGPSKPLIAIGAVSLGLAVIAGGWLVVDRIRFADADPYSSSLDDPPPPTAAGAWTRDRILATVSAGLTAMWAISLNPSLDLQRIAIAILPVGLAVVAAVLRNRVIRWLASALLVIWGGATFAYAFFITAALMSTAAAMTPRDPEG